MVIRNMSNNDIWYKVADCGIPINDTRIHCKVNERYVTIFRHKSKLYCIDSICHHAGGPLTLGPLLDIEELDVTVVLCPWHKFMVSIDGGLKAYQGVDFPKGKPIVSGWKLGKIVQRPHKVIENSTGVYVSLQITDIPCTSDNDSYNSLCTREYEIYTDINSSSSYISEEICVDIKES